ncbi:RNA-binding domain-containing protein [Pontibacter virosus]|nr:RNA-binding domain-containing protein [Pontibacter virosus]
MLEFSCLIEGEKKIKNEFYFILKSTVDSSEHIIPVKQLRPLNIKVGETHTFYKEFNKKHKKHFIRLKLEPKYYKIKGFQKGNGEQDCDKEFFLVEDENKNIIKVPCFEWQKKETWEHEYLRCQVKGYHPNGSAILTNRENRHPIYKIGKEYIFEVIASKKKILNDKEYDYYEVLGEDGCVHEVNMLNGQSLNYNKVDRILCKVVDISHRLRLTQVKSKDPYFTRIDNIVINKTLISKYFNPIITAKVEDDKDIIQLIQQYESESAFWVFTFTNKILLRKLQEELKKYNYPVAREINQLIIIFESWIIKRGIITSIPDEYRKESTLIKAKSQLNSAIIIDNVLEELAKNRYDFLDKLDLLEDTGKSLAKVYYLILFSNIELISEKKFIVNLKELLNNLDIEAESNYNYLNKLLNLISKKKKSFIVEEEEAYFNLTSVYASNLTLEDSQRKYVYWSYAELLLANKLGNLELFNLLVGQLLRRWIKTESLIDNKHTLLINSYYHFENLSSPLKQPPFVFNNEELVVDFNKLINVDEFESQNLDTWLNLEENFIANSTIIVKLVKRTKTGFEVEFNGLKGFLPNHLITARILKTYVFEDCDFIISAKCLAFSSFFKFFLVSQLPSSDSKYFIQNNNIFRKGGIYDGIIKRVESYGCFISTASGEGLLHVSNIFDFYWNEEFIYDYFPEGKKIRVVVTDISEDGKIGFSLIELKYLEPYNYREFVDEIFSVDLENIDSVRTDDRLDSVYVTAQKEKALCFEQLAVLQLSIQDKLNSFKLAKQFYANTNNARSYLADIYTSYFQILLQINECLIKQTLKGIRQIKLEAEAIKSSVSLQTLKTFPDSEKLIYFLDIISLFNEKNDESTELLYNYSLNYSKDTSKGALKTIAKITLANNLLVSETKDEDEFSLKNLRLIYDYISNGVLSLSETIEDKHDRERKEEILYWKEMIKGDENEKLEFKSSLFTPILDEERQHKLDLLKKIEKKTDVIKKDIDRINGDLAKKAIIHSSLKTLAAFANTSGGTLLLGVSDNKRVLGLEQEYLSFNKKSDQGRDGFGKYFDNVVKDYLGDSFSSLMTRKFLRFPEGDVLIITVKPSLQEVFLLKDEEGNYSEQLYIRNLSSSKALWGIELTKFIKNKHINQLESKHITIEDQYN